jgi:hypothetical protein
MALFAVVQEVIWIRRLIKDLQYQVDGSTTVYQDNKSTIMLVQNPTFHNRSKHIAIKYHFSREQVENNTVTIKYKPTQEMVADALTKNVSKHRMRSFCEDISLTDIDDQMECQIKGRCQ